jgi:ABC-type uncharacterized transport system permease subunit
VQSGWEGQYSEGASRLTQGDAPIVAGWGYTLDMILSGALYSEWVLGILAVLAYAVPAVVRGLGARGMRLVLLAAWALHGASLAVGLLGLAGGAHFGFGPAVSTTAWLVLTVYALESRLYPQLQSRTVLASWGALAVLVGLVFPGKVLHAQASLWLPLHWALGIASYGLFAAAVVHAWLMTRSEAQMRLGAAGDASQVDMPLMTLERLMFALVMAGFILLSATLLVGWGFSESLYGAGVAWKWNHKTIFSVMSWLVFALLLWGRWQWGWRGKRAVRVLYLGAGLLLLAYVGSRFVLEIILQRGA